MAPTMGLTGQEVVVDLVAVSIPAGSMLVARDLADSVLAGAPPWAGTAGGILPSMRRATGWTLIGVAAWLCLGVLFAVISVLSGNTGKPGTEVSTGTAILAAVTLAAIAVTLGRVGLHLIRPGADGQS